VHESWRHCRACCHVLLQGICMAVLQGGLLNLASLFPPIYIQVGRSGSRRQRGAPLRPAGLPLCLISPTSNPLR
jgi:hypothetical protein